MPETESIDRVDESVAPQQPDLRAHPRSNMFLAAVIHAGQQQAPAKVRNMSARGAMVESDLLPPPGTQVHLIRGPLCAAATIIWRTERQCGVHFTGEVSVKTWLAPPANVEQGRVDQMMADIRSGRASAAMAPAAATPVSREEIVEDLGTVYRLIDDLSDALADTPELVMEHATKLQNLDMAMQMLAALAQEVANDGGQRGAGARLQDLRTACAQALRKG